MFILRNTKTWGTNMACMIWYIHLGKAGKVYRIKERRWFLISTGHHQICPLCNGVDTSDFFQNFAFILRKWSKLPDILLKMHFLSFFLRHFLFESKFPMIKRITLFIKIFFRALPSNCYYILKSIQVSLN